MWKSKSCGANVSLRMNYSYHNRCLCCHEGTVCTFNILFQYVLSPLAKLTEEDFRVSATPITQSIPKMASMLASLDDGFEVRRGSVQVLQDVSGWAKPTLES